MYMIYISSLKLEFIFFNGKRSKIHRFVGEKVKEEKQEKIGNIVISPHEFTDPSGLL